MRLRLRVGLPLAALLMSVAPLCLPARAQSDGSQRAQRQQRLVDRATLTAEDILDSNDMGKQTQRLLARARGVLICPSIFRVSFLFGGSGGGCTLMARDGAGSWSDPAFYSMASGSVGFQAGIQDAELMMFIMNPHGLRAIMDSQFKFGANASATIATLGAGIEGATSTALDADIVAVEKSKGLFAGISLQGSKLNYDSIGSQAYYGQSVGVHDIVVSMRVNNPGADPLRAALMRYGSGTASASGRPNTAYDNPDTTSQGTTGPTQLAPSSPVQSQPLPPPH